jgi:hypothetical protein
MKKVYDLLIIGSGAASLGILKGVPNKISVAMITPRSHDDFTKDSQGDFAYRNAFGGWLDIWHGVSSYELFFEHFPNEHNAAFLFFNKMYHEDEKVFENLIKTGIYIPNKKINTNTLKSRIEEINCDLIIDTAEKIIDDGLDILVRTKSGYSVQAKKIILCAGAFGTMNLLCNSDLGEKKLSLSNHINGYLSLNSNVSNSMNNVYRGKQGHIKKVSLGIVSGKKYMTYMRPANFDFKNKLKLIRHKSIYSRNTNQIYKNVLMSTSPGLLIEALYNRYGYWYGGSANTYFQIEADGIYTYDNGNVDLNPAALKQFLDKLRGNDLFSGVIDETIVSGIHYFNSVSASREVGFITNQSDWDRKILLADTSYMKTIGATHHTFSVMAINALAIGKIYG